MNRLWSKLRPILILMLPAFAIGAVLGAYPGYKAYEYVWKDPNFCTSCHVHDYASLAWKESSHGSLTTCHDCHHQPLHAYVMEPISLILYHPQFPKDLKHTPHVPADLCESCHISKPDFISNITGPMAKQDVRKIPKVDQMYLHHVHLNQKTKMPMMKEMHEIQSIKEIEEEFSKPSHPAADARERPINCMDCHGGPVNRAHNFKAVDLACVRCHSTQHKTPIGKVYGCKNCHFQEFLVPLSEPGPLESARNRTHF